MPFILFISSYLIGQDPHKWKRKKKATKNIHIGHRWRQMEKERDNGGHTEKAEKYEDGIAKNKRNG